MNLSAPARALSDRTLVICAGAATLIAFVFLGFQIFAVVDGNAQGARLGAQLTSLYLRIDRLNLQRLDAVSTVVDSSDPEAARRFRELDAAQSEALVQMNALTAIPQEEAAAGAATFAYHTMVALESDAVALALAERNARAHDELYTPDYAAALAAFGEAMARMREASWVRLGPVQARMARATVMTAIVGPLAALLILGLLGLVLSRLSQLAARVSQAEAGLGNAVAEITRREREFLASLIVRCPAPAVQFEFEPALKLVAWLRQRGIDDLESWLKVYPGEIRKLAPQFSVARANKALADLIGAGDAAQLKDVGSWISERSLHQCALAFLRALWTRSPMVYTSIEVRTFSGEERRFDLHGSLVAKAKGKTPSLFAFLIDVSELASLRDEIDQLRAVSAETVRVQDEFLTTVSRDLRAALDGVIGMSAALDRTRLDTEQREALVVIRDSGDIMRDTLDRARDFRRLQAGDIEIGAEPFDVASLAQTINARFSPRAKAKGLRLRMSVEEAARIRVVGDDNRVRQILSKLIGNAIEFTPHGEVEARVLLEAGSEGAAQLVMIVRDTGAGLTAAELERALTAGVGTGGGLALCRRLCAAMGGGMEINSSSDYGTTVTARVRVAEAEADSAEPGVPAAEATSPLGRRVALLAADDNAVNRIVLKDMLEPLDVDLTMVDNGADAIAAWRARAFDAILLDIHMPVLSGHDVAREIRRIETEEGRSPTPIIAVSASVMKSEVEACLAAGMDAHVAKPIELPKLKDAIAAAIAPAPGAAEAAA
jgi:signal transduction histidine kinase/CheY-like chemotaxis protein